MRNRSLIEIHLAVFLFGLAGLFGKWIPLSPVIIVLGRVFFASLSLGVILLLMGQSLRVRPAGHYALLFLMGLILSVHWFAFFQAIKVSTVAVGLLSYSSFPVFTVFIEPLFFREKFEGVNILFALLCLAGVFLIVPRFSLDNSIYRGVLWGLLSGLTFSLLTILNRKLSLIHSSLVVAFFQDLFSALLLLPFFFILRPGMTISNLSLLLVLGILCTALSHTLFIKGMKRIKAQIAAIISSLEPVYGIVLAYLFLKEIPRLRTLFGGLIILGSALFVSLRSASKTG